MIMAINIKAGVPDLFRNEEHDTQANLFKNNFHPESIENANEAVAMRGEIMRPEQNQELHKF